VFAKHLFGVAYFPFPIYPLQLLNITKRQNNFNFSLMCASDVKGVNPIREKTTNRENEGDRQIILKLISSVLFILLAY